MSLFSKLSTKDFFSLDIETDNRSHMEGSVWSIGAKGNNINSEQFFDLSHSARSLDEDAINAIKSKFTNSSPFHAKQEELGRFNEYYAALRSGNHAPQSNVGAYANNLINQNSVLLIQNAAFENRFLSKAINEAGLGNSIRSKMAYTGSPDSGRYLYTPPEVTNQRAYAAQAYDMYNKGLANFSDVSNAYGRMMNAYEDSIAAGKGAMVVDLMDITKSVYAKAAERGLMAKNSISIGTGMEFLAKHFLGATEEHKALADASQQMEVFNKMLPIYDELVSGNISEDTRSLFRSISKAQPMARSVQMLRAMRTAIEESQSEGYKRIDAKVVKRVSTVYPKGEKGINVLAYTSPLEGRALVQSITKDADAAALHAMKRYDSSFTPGVSRNMLLDSINNAPSIADKLKILTKAEEDIHAGKHLHGNILPSMEAGVGIAKTHITRARGWFNGLTSGQKIAIGGLAAIGGIALLADSPGSEDRITEIKKRREIEERKYSLENNIRMYANIEHYHGSGFADFNERTKHHEY
jgi:hypothetical protein